MSAEWAFGLFLLVVAVVATLHFLRVISIPFLPSHTTAFQVVLDGVAADFTDSRKAAVQRCVARKCSYAQWCAAQHRPTHRSTALHTVV